MLLSGNVNQNKGSQEGPTKIAKRYRMRVAISTNISFSVCIVRQTKGAAVCLHSAKVTRRDGTWVTVLSGVRKVFVRVWHKNETKNTPALLERKNANQVAT